jgi:hypothetical protein
LGLIDYSAFNQATGGWTAIGGTAAATTTITDSITALGIASYGLLANAEDHLDTYNNRMNLRLRTTAAGATTNNASVSWDFGLVSLMWVETVSNITISGTVYQTDESTALTSQPAMKLAVGDSTAYTTTANADGTFSFTNVSPPSVGTVLTIWLDTNILSDKASLVFKYGSSCNGYPDCTGLSLYQNRVNIDNKDTGNITNSDLAACDNDSGTACSDTDIGFTSNAGALTLTFATNMLRITSGVTFAPGGNVTAQKLRVAGTYSGGSETLTLIGTGSGTTCGAAAQMPLCVDGTFNASSNTTKFTGDADLTIAVQTYNNLLLAPSLVANVTYTFASAPSLTINGDFTINPSGDEGVGKLIVNMGGSITVASNKTLTITSDGIASSELNTTASNYNLSTGFLNIASSGTLIANGSTITLTGTSGTLFTNNGTFNAGTSTVVMDPDASVTLTSGTITFNNLTLSPSLNANRTYTFGSGALTINGDFTINPKDPANSSKLNVNMGADITVAASKTTTIGGTNTATSELNTTASNYNLSTGFLNIASSGTLTANGSTITLTGTSGTLFTRNGTFNAGGSTVVMNPDASVTLTSGTITFNNLTLSPSLNANRTYTFGSGALTINGDFTINPSGAEGGEKLIVNMGGSITVASNKTLTITSDGIASSELNTTASNYNLSTGFLNIASSGTLTANGSTITLTGTSGTLFTRNGAFNAGTSTVVMNPDASVTLTSGTITFNNLTLSPTLTANRTYTFGSGALTINGDFNINPNDPANSSKLNVNMGADITVAASKTTTIGGTNTAASELNTTASNYNLSTGFLNIASSGTLTANGSTITLTGTSGTLFTRNGTFNASGSTVVMNPNASVTLTSGTITFYNLNLTSAINANRTYTFGSGAITIDNNFTIQPSCSGICFSAVTLTVNLGANLTVNKTTTIQGNPSSQVFAILDTTASNYTLNLNSLNINSGATLKANGSTVQISGDYTNNGTFNAGTSTVVLNGTGLQSLSGTMTGSSAFYNLTITNNSGASASDCERTGFTASVDFNSAATATNDYTINTANVRIEYNSGSTYTFNNIKWNGQAAGTRIYFRNSLTSGTWLLNVSGTQAVSYVNVSRSDASPGDTIDATDGTSVDCGNNTNWNFFTPTISYSISANSLFLGNLNPTAVFSNSHDVTVSTNAPSGYVLYVYEDGNLRQEIGEFVFDIDDVTDGSVTAGSEEYGLNTGFDDFVSDSAITSTMKIARQSSSAVSNQTTTCTYKAAVSNSTVAGFYSHIVTYIVTGRF